MTAIRAGTQPPAWARRLIVRVCADHRRRIPDVRWRTRADTWTSGSAYLFGGGISITAGTDRALARIVVLHELAHHLVGPERQHDGCFWRRCWSLYERYDVDLRLAWTTETEYRKRSATYAPPRVRARFDPGRS
jgi:hypothetical protein